MFDFGGLLWGGLVIGLLLGAVLFRGLPFLWAWMGWNWTHSLLLGCGFVLGSLFMKVFKE